MSTSPLATAALTAILLPCVIADLAAQTDTSPTWPTGDFIVPIHTAPPDPEGGEYGIWAAGSTYKVSFHDGMAFHPFDPNAEKDSARVRWRTLSARVGAEELVTRSAPIHRHSELRYEYDWGGVVEAYDVRADGLEQTFVLRERPRIDGNLVIRGRLSGPLAAPARGRAHQELPLADRNGRPRVGYGAVTAVDARGRRAAMRTRHLGGIVELDLDASWLATASYPVVVDPLLTNKALETDPYGIFDVDVFRDDEQQDGNLWVVYSLKTASNDTDLVVRRYPDGFALGATVFADLSSTWRSEEGRITGVGGYGTGHTVTAFTRRFVAGPRVRIHTHLKSSYALSSSYISAPHVTGTHQWRPDVGGTHAGELGSRAVIVFQLEAVASFANTDESQVHAMVIDAASGSVVSQPTLLTGAPGQDQERPTVNRLAEGGPNTEWLAVWQQYANAAQQANWSIQGRLVKGSGQFSAGALSITPHTAGDDQETGPRVDGADGRYVVAFARSDLATIPYKWNGADGMRVYAQRVDWPSDAATGTLPFAAQRIRSDVAPRYRVTDCAFDTTTRSHWAIGVANTYNGHYHAHKLGYRGASIEFGNIYTASTFTTEGGGVCFDQRNGRFAFAFPADTTSTDILLGTFMTYENVQPAATYGNACSNATITWNGSQHVGEGYGHVEVGGTDAGAPVLLMVSLASDNLPLDPLGLTGCELLVGTGLGYLGMLWSNADASGVSRFGLPIPEKANRPTLYFQSYWLSPGANALDLVGSHGLRVPFGR